ncbi:MULTISPECIES: MMPL family transporter [unclassified Fibrobacter]|uniref:MMPL family transporter n=1 Tax=unclassified Fibrobacter TaxID=2634177 RepID=UPI001304A78C|nr:MULTISPECIES: MMPL family transporter [unclassified Fibrobacter]
MMIGLFLTITLLCIYPIENLRWEIQLQDTLKGHEVQADYQTIEKAFGGLGSLIVVIQSKDSAANYTFAQKLARHLENDPAVHYTEYYTDLEFFKKNRLLYASENDLDQVIEKLDKIKDEQIKKHNPLLVDLSETEQEKPVTRDSIEIISQIEAKYFKSLQQDFSNQQGSIRVIDIYPATSVSDLQANRELLKKVERFVEENGNGIHVYYTGKVYDSIKVGKALLPEAKFAGGMAALIILVLLIINFYRQPQLIFISAVPLALPTVFTLALAYILFGRINLFTLSLGLLLPGHACQVLTHVYTRYFHEREKKLSPALCIESALLGIGPVVAASSLVMASLFSAFILVPLPGLREFGILGAIGSVLNLMVCPLLTASLLLLLQRKKPFQIQFESITPTQRRRLFSFKTNWIIIVTISVVSAAAWLYSGKNLSFLYDFKKTELQTEEREAKALIAETGFSTYDPIIVMLPDSSYNDDLVENFEHLQKKGRLKDLGKIYTQYQFLPKISIEKKHKIETLRKLISDDVLARLNPKDSAAIVEMFDNYENDIKDFVLSENIRRKFADKRDNPGVFAFIIPSSDPNNGLTCRHIAKQLQQLDGIHDKTFKICGTPILRASLLDTILGNINKSILLGTVLLWIILLMFYNKLSRAFFTLLPSLFAMSWVTILVHIFDIQISAYSSIAFVLLIGASVDGSLQLWSSYYEKQNGNAWSVLQTKLISVMIAQGASFIGAIAMLFSSHPGINGMGLIAALGLICIFISHFTIYPLVASTLDAYRILKKAKLRHERLIHKNS